VNVGAWVYKYPQARTAGSDQGLGVHHHCCQDGAAVAPGRGVATTKAKKRQTQEQKLLDAVSYVRAATEEIS